MAEARAGTPSIRHTISMLCTDLLGQVGIGYVQPEAVRQCKFDSPEPRSIMWRLLHDLVLVAESWVDRRQPLPDDWLSSLWSRVTDMDSPQDFVVGFVHSRLRLLGYSGCPSFFSFTWDRASSRELLLAAAWLLAAFGILASCAMLRGLQLAGASDCATSTLLPPYREDTSSAAHADQQAREEQTKGRQVFSRARERLCTGQLDLSNAVKMVQALCGKTALQLRKLACSEHERTSRLHKLRVLTAEAVGPGSNTAMTMFFAFLLRHKKTYSKHLHAMEAAAAALKDHRDALVQHQVLLWRWMQSVANERTNGSGRQCDNSDDIAPRPVNRGQSKAQRKLAQQHKALVQRLADLDEQAAAMQTLFSKVARNSRGDRRFRESWGRAYERAVERCQAPCSLGDDRGQIEDQVHAVCLCIAHSGTRTSQLAPAQTDCYRTWEKRQSSKASSAAGGTHTARVAHTALRTAFADCKGRLAAREEVVRTKAHQLLDERDLVIFD
eukprot:m.233098 g.233098  ORF g.233098 m.233098 type:complete len:497 (+) comp18894_c0_seq1:210-1700(+)